MPAFTLIGRALEGIRWLARAPSREFYDVLATTTDILVSGAQEAMLGAYGPSPPSDAVPLIAKDRSLVAGLVEPPTDFAVRASTWLDTRRKAGNVRTVLDALAAVWAPESPRIRCVRNFGWSAPPHIMKSRWTTREPDGTFSEHIASPANFIWGPTTRAHEAYFIIYAPTTPPIAPEGYLGDGLSKYGERGVRPYDGVQDKPTTGTNAFSDYIARTREAIAKTAPASLRVPWIIVAFDSASFDPTAAPGSPGMPDGTWYVPARLDVGTGNYVKTRLATARYWVGFR